MALSRQLSDEQTALSARPFVYDIWLIYPGATEQCTWHLPTALSMAEERIYPNTLSHNRTVYFKKWKGNAYMILLYSAYGMFIPIIILCRKEILEKSRQ